MVTGLTLHDVKKMYFLCNIDESKHSIVMFLNCTFICCYIKSMFDYFLAKQKPQISWNDEKNRFLLYREVFRRCINALNRNCLLIKHKSS